jgi:hypothetical protein
MTAQVEFFCSPREEIEVLRYLTQAAGVQVFDVTQQKLMRWADFSPGAVPDWTQPIGIHLWNSAHGSLIWHTSCPEVAGPTHGSFVKNFFAQLDWKSLGLGNRDRLIDTDLSPILQYTRGDFRDGRRRPNTVLAPPEQPESSWCGV